MSWSLTIGATTQSLDDWGISSASLSFASLGPDAFMFSIPAEDGLAAHEINHGDAVVLTQDATVRFRGEIVRRGQQADPSEGYSYEAAGPWHYLEHLVFEQSWKVFAGWLDDIPGGTALLSDASTSHIVLNQSPLGVLQGTRSQLAEILQYAIDDGADIQFTEAQLADMNIPKREQQDMLCSEGITRQLDYMDAVTWFDYSTTPPTFHCKRRSDLAGVSLAIGSNISALNLVPRDEQQVPFVQIKFEKAYQDTFGVSLQISEDIYPDPLPAQKKGGLVATIVLAPTVTTTLVQELTVGAIPEAGDSDATKLNFFKSVKSELEDTDEYGSLALVSGSYARVGTAANYITDGAIAPWMDGTVEDDEVGCKVSYTQKDTADSTSVDGHKVREQNVVVRVKATDLESGTYKTTYTDDAGEDPSEFAGIAQQIYDDLNALAWSGTVVIVEDEPTFSVGIGNVLNLTGAQAAWATMNALVRGVSVDIMTGTTTLDLSPNPHLAAGQIVDLLRVNRTRWLTGYAGSRTNANVGGGENSLPNKLPRENTTEAARRYSEHRVSGPDSSGQYCAETKAVDTSHSSKPTFVLAQRTSGGLSTEKILLQLSRALGKEIKLREAKVCTPTTTGYAIILASERYATPLISGETPLGSDDVTP